MKIKIYIDYGEWLKKSEYKKLCMNHVNQWKSKKLENFKQRFLFRVDKKVLLRHKTHRIFKICENIGYNCILLIYTQYWKNMAYKVGSVLINYCKV